MSAGITRDPQKDQDEADVRKHIAAFLAGGGKPYQAAEGETAMKGNQTQAFTITAANKKGAV